MPFVFITDTFLPKEEAHVSIEERGFRFADGVFETISVYETIPYQWDLHMQRLESGLAAIRLKADISGLRSICKELVARNEMHDCVLRIYISRGIGSRGYLPVPAASDSPTIVIETLDRHFIPSNPITLWLSAYEKPSLKALPLQHKIAQGMNQTLARMEAVERSCFEALQLDAAGHICECSSANIFWLKDGRLFTPALTLPVLAGTTRDAILRLSHRVVEQGAYKLNALEEAEAVFISNSNWLALPVSKLSPKSYTWRSEEIAQEINQLLAEDIKRSTTQRQAG